MERLRRQLSGTVTVEVDAAPSIDLAQMMDNMRQQYETMADKYREEAKQRFEKQVMMAVKITLICLAQQAGRVLFLSLAC